jgi:hypothetical protein
LLAHFDETKGQYDPNESATFLFVTREGGYGALLVGSEVTDTSMGYIKGRRLSYRLIEDPAK